MIIAIYIIQEITNINKISKSSSDNYLHQLDYVNYFDVWIKQKDKIYHISLYILLIKHNESIH